MKNIETLKHIVSVYQKQLAQMSTINETIEVYQSLAHSEKDMLYWDLIADFGRSHSKMCLEWAERCIAHLEELEQ